MEPQTGFHRRFPNDTTAPQSVHARLQNTKDIKPAAIGERVVGRLALREWIPESWGALGTTQRSTRPSRKPLFPNQRQPTRNGVSIGAQENRNGATRGTTISVYFFRYEWKKELLRDKFAPSMQTNFQTSVQLNRFEQVQKGEKINVISTAAYAEV